MNVSMGKNLGMHLGEHLSNKQWFVKMYHIADVFYVQNIFH